MRTVCGFGSMDDPAHLAGCLACNAAAWREYDRANPGRARRLMDRLLGRLPAELPAPPEVKP